MLGADAAAALHALHALHALQVCVLACVYKYLYIVELPVPCPLASGGAQVRSIVVLRQSDTTELPSLRTHPTNSCGSLMSSAKSTALATSILAQMKTENR